MTDMTAEVLYTIKQKAESHKSGSTTELAKSILGKLCAYVQQLSKQSRQKVDEEKEGVARKNGICFC